MSIDQYHPIYTEDQALAVYDLIKSGSWLSDHVYTAKFESELKKHIGSGFVSCVNNGTIAISLALLAGKITSGDTVLVPNLTMIATSTACEFIGCKVAFCDVDHTGCLDVDSAIEILKKNKNIRAVIYVTLNGRINERKILELRNYCLKNNILLIKDDAQSLGSFSGDTLSLQSAIYADFHTLSFSPHKIISTGQGGAIVTSNQEYYERVERLKDFGRLNGIGGDIHNFYGINSKFTEIQAVLGLQQLKVLTNRINFKRILFNSYKDKLKHLKQITFMESCELWTPWFVDIYLYDADIVVKLQSFLNDNGIQTRRMYPQLTSQEIYYDESSYPNAHNLSNTGLWLPSSFDLKEEQIIYICEKIKEFYEQK